MPHPLLSIIMDINMAFKHPPAIVPSPFSTIAKEFPDEVDAYMEFFSACDDQGRYLHWDKLRFRLKEGMKGEYAWSLVKLARSKQLQRILWLSYDPPVDCKMMLTPCIQMAISEADRHTTDAALEWMSSKIGEQHHYEYLLKDLVEDEAISSSQLEGAATTTKIARELLTKARGPRTMDEKMIVGNYAMMNHAWANRNKEFSSDLLLEFHQIGVDGIDDEKYHPGEFRNSDDVVVEDGDGNVVHTPPPAAQLTFLLMMLEDWVNTNHSTGNTKHFIHPLVKATIMHFIIGYLHPFHDGNGRVARTIFYWFMFKRGFAAFRFIAISTLLKAAPIQYGKSYLATETDEMDLTYFVDYQCRTISRAIKDYLKHYNETLEGIQQFNAFLYESGLFGKLNDKQRVVLQVAKLGPYRKFTANNVQENLNCSYNTAASILNGLVNHNVFEKNKVGREWIYTMRSRKDIISNWKE